MQAGAGARRPFIAKVTDGWEGTSITGLASWHTLRAVCPCGRATDIDHPRLAKRHGHALTLGILRARLKCSNCGGSPALRVSSLPR